MEAPVVNYYAQRKNLISLGAAIPIILTFPNRVMVYLTDFHMRMDAISALPPKDLITVSENGAKFGLEPGSRVVVKVKELQAYLHWWENNRTGYYRPDHWSAANTETPEDMQIS